MPVIMMAQNRASQVEKLAGELDYRINLKAELEIQALNDKLDYYLVRQWRQLVALQRTQLQNMIELHSIVARVSSHSYGHKEWKRHGSHTDLISHDDSECDYHTNGSCTQ
jgi:uncharacterized membrane protein